jgi:N-methylhydantoinase B
MLTNTSVTVLSDRRRTGPYGAQGGARGGVGRNTLIREGQEQVLPGKVQLELRAGDRLRIETPGGGGYGRKSGST